MTIYDELQSTVRDVMGEFKQGLIDYVSITPGNGPEDNPGDPVIETVPLDAAARGVKYKYVANGTALASDLQVTSPVLEGVTFRPNGFVDIDGIRYKIVELLPIPPAGTPVAYTFIVRK